MKKLLKAPEGSAQQGFHLLSFGQDENLVIICSAFVQLVWRYAGVAEGNLFFFGGGEKMERKSSFAVFGFAAGGADCKCAFSCAVELVGCFLNGNSKI